MDVMTKTKVRLGRREVSNVVKALYVAGKWWNGEVGDGPLALGDTVTSSNGTDELETGRCNKKDHISTVCRCFYRSLRLT